MSVLKFNKDTHIANQTEKVFVKHLPEDLPIDTFVRVDQYREQWLADRTTEAIDYAVTKGVGSGEGTGVSVPEIHMGGNCTGSIYIDPSFNLLVSEKHSQSDLLGVVINRGRELYDQFNNGPDGSDSVSDASIEA